MKSVFIIINGSTAAHPNTPAHWICQTLESAGIDMAKLYPYSTHQASASAAFARAMPVDEIMQLAKWTTADIFHKYYCRPIEHLQAPSDFVHSQQLQHVHNISQAIFSKCAKICHVLLQLPKEDIGLKLLD